VVATVSVVGVAVLSFTVLAQFVAGALGLA